MQAGKAGALGQQVVQELLPRLAKAKGKTRDCHGNDLNSGPSDVTYWLVTTGPSLDCEMGKWCLPRSSHRVRVRMR